jgi:hypothetical protein
VVRANSSVELKGFERNNIVHNKFKFIEFTKEVEEKIDYSPEFGLIRVEVWYEKLKPVTQKIVYNYEWNYKPQPYVYPKITWNDTGGWQTYSVSNSIQSSGGTRSCAMASSSDNPEVSLNYSQINDVGITTKGSKCHQEFYNVYMDLEEQSNVFVLKLSGYKDENAKVTELIGAKEKLTCPNCQKRSKYNNNFCAKCGTPLG